MRVTTILFIAGTLAGLLVASGCSRSDDSNGDRTVSIELGSWSGVVSFESRSSTLTRTDAFEFDDMAWDGERHFTSARWEGCQELVDGTVETCGDNDAQCSFRGSVDNPDRNDFELVCHAKGGDYPGENAPCGLGDAAELCAVEAVVTAGNSDCDNGDLQPYVFCANLVSVGASSVTGNHEWSDADTTYLANWEIRDSSVR